MSELPSIRAARPTWGPSEADLDEAAFLDEAFDALLAAAQRGEALDSAPWILARPRLSDAIDELLRTVRVTCEVELTATMRFGGYELIGELGHGAMGRVFLARQAALGQRLVALKVLPPAVRLSRRARERFLHEARSLARVRHANVVTVHDVIEEPEVLAFAMEWIDGPNLAKVIAALVPADGAPRDDSDASRRLAEVLPQAASVASLGAFVCGIGVALARALECMHAAGLVHRDVKPSNVLMRKDGTALLSDFGLVHDETHSLHTASGAVLGTVGYAAPELLRGEHHMVGPSADVFGLGATLYHLACGVAPFGHSSATEVLRRMESTTCAPPRRWNRALPRDLDTILVKALEPNPARRYASCAELGDELQRVLDLRPIRARRIGLIERAWRRVRREQRLFTALSIGLTLGLLFGGLLALHRWQSRQREARGAELVHDARGLLISHGPANLSFFHIAGANSELEPVKPGIALALDPEIARRSLAGLDEAIELGVDDLDVATDHHLLALYLTLAEHEHMERPTVLAGHRFAPTFEAHLPGAARVLRGWGELRTVGDFDTHLIAELTVRERRAVGLFAMLVSRDLWAVRAWSSIDPTAVADPLIQFIVGDCYRMRGQIALGYPLLLRALEACPDAPRIGAAACSAALDSGDVAGAAKILAGIDPRSLAPTDTTLTRLHADLAWAQGDLARAETLYVEAFEREGNPIALQRHGRMLEQRGDLLGAWRRFAYLAYQYSSWAEVRADLARALDAWWQRMDAEAKRVALLREVAAHGYAAVELLRTIESAETATNRTHFFAPLLAGRELHFALVAQRLRPPFPDDPHRSAVPWSSSASVDTTDRARPIREIDRLAALAGVFHPAGGAWCDLSPVLRLALARWAFASDTLLARSAARDDTVQLAASYALGRGVRLAVRALVGR